ncbi:MAG: hypothetical protein LBV46_03255, partial [Bacteroidales bacterium]|nr:hypothetical protein [Bacteroidales bacterium]
ENQVDGDTHGDCAGLCSPFCVCNACPGFSVEITPRLVMTALSQGSTVPSFSDFSYIPKRSIPAIWQPPKA